MFCFPIVLRGLGYFRFRKLDVFARFNQSDCGFKKNYSNISGIIKFVNQFFSFFFFLFVSKKRKKTQKSPEIF